MTRRSSLRESSVGKKIGIFFIVVIVVFGVIFGGKIIKYIPVLYDLAFKKEIALRQSDQRINILLLGIGGGKHDGPNLTDTLILASVDPQTNKVTLISVPRDLWIPDLKAKINSAYAYGESRQKGGGLILAKAVVSKVVGQKIDYALRVDFAGFIKAVDMVGGLDVYVDRRLDDPEYPVSGKEADTCGHKEEELELLATASSQLEAFPCRYEHLIVEAGEQHIDGETALKFVRSRHALGVEGSDFARSQRQEKVIAAFRDKVFSLGTVLNPVKIVSLYDVLKDSIDTDIKEEEYDDFVRLSQKMQRSKLQSVVIDVGDAQQERQGLLDAPGPSEAYKYQWVLTPLAGDGNYTQIHRFVACEIKYEECDVLTGRPVSPTPSPTSGE